MDPEEHVTQKLPYRCPYCDQPIDYDRFDLKEGENAIECPSCHRVYIKIITPIFLEDESK